MYIWLILVFKVPDLSQANPCGICGKWSGPGKGFSLSI